MSVKVLSVSQVNGYIKDIFLRDILLSSLEIRGEISNCKYHSSGHIYFTLKDEKSSLAAVMFKGSREKGLSFILKDGQKVVIRGKVEVFERDGKYQLYANNITLDGIGKLYEEFERIKKRLEAEGLFDKAHKKVIPRFPKKVGVVTAETGAAIQDIMNIARRRNPFVELILYPAKVQGEGAADTVVKGIKCLDAYGVDTIIIGRGGGSIEDLWCFNEEKVARAVYECDTPIISAVGHEIDYTIADFVSDLRAPTPSAAAELAVSDLRGTLGELDGIKRALELRMFEKIKVVKLKLEKIELRLKKESPESRLRQYELRLAEYEDDFRNRMEKKITLYSNRLEKNRVNLFNTIKLKYEKTNRRLSVVAARLDGLSPLSRLAGGYSYTEDADGKNIRSIKQVNKDTEIKVTLSDGKLIARVKEIVNG